MSDYLSGLKPRIGAITDIRRIRQETGCSLREAVGISQEQRPDLWEPRRPSEIAARARLVQPAGDELPTPPRPTVEQLSTTRDVLLWLSAYTDHVGELSSSIARIRHLLADEVERREAR